MKKILSNAALLFACVCVLTACKDDNDSNPTLTQPTTFVLNEPVVGTGLVDLANTEVINLTWSQPTPYNNYNAPVVPTYTIQLSSVGTFNQEFDENLEDNTGADFISLSETYSSGNVDVTAETIAKALQQLNGWEQAAVPATLDVYFRIKSAIRDASFKEYYTILSNTQKVRVIPYYIELSDAPVEIWYLTGGCIADGSWSNSQAAIGSGMTPMYMKPGFEYDKKTGKGEIEYAGYFPEGANFKIIAPEGLSNWNYGLCGGNEEGGQVYRDGGDDPGNISVTTAGYYKLTLNTETHELVWEKLSDTQGAYTQMSMPGDYQGWDVASNLMTPLTTATENHDWVIATVTYDADTNLKFAADGGWAVNWGGTAFPFGTGTQDGPNIPVTAGTYKVFFNDLLGNYMFIPVE
ncbi:MAG: SusE domain-containing protein [Prevotella sp.]|nr:SusE domain-containing protein [Prevotella sp.]